MLIRTCIGSSEPRAASRCVLLELKITYGRSGVRNQCNWSHPYWIIPMETSSGTERRRDLRVVLDDEALFRLGSRVLLLHLLPQRPLERSQLSLNIALNLSPLNNVVSIPAQEVVDGLHANANRP